MSTQQVSNDAAVCLLTNVISVNHVETMYYFTESFFWNTGECV